MDKGTIIISVLTIVVLGGIIYVSSPAANTTGESIEGLEKVERTDRTHTNQEVSYDRTPPVGGSHSPTWLDCNAAVYDDPVDNGHAVHALEHGAVWISYQPGVSTSTVDQLQSHLQNYTFLSPVPNQDAPIKLSAWGNQLSVESADDPRITAFLDTFRQGPQTPESGASCNPPNGSMPQGGGSHHEHEDVNHYHGEQTEGHHEENGEATSSAATSSQE